MGGVQSAGGGAQLSTLSAGEDSGSMGASSSGTNTTTSQAVFGSGDPISIPQKDNNFIADPDMAVINITPRTEDADLLQRILDRQEEPRDLPLALLQSITNNFSDSRVIGRGGFGVVYKGVKWIDEDRVLVLYTVAVKRIHIFNDDLFLAEVTSLMKIKHQNIVRFLGFFSNTHREKKSGRLVNVNERLLCLEYISNGSLDKYISDELRGFQWETRYEIITGICEGLRHLHEDKSIIHMDLKPGNILLDGKNMVPKITDFGLSRQIKKTHTMGQPIGTSGYIAPEYRKESKTTTACDIYSLGAIIRELVTGDMNTSNKHNVLRRWRHRWNEPPTQLRYQQVTRCIQIARDCRKEKPEERPLVSEIISFLRASESIEDQDISAYQDDDMLGIEPLNLELNMDMSWSVKLTNKTKTSFSFNIEGRVQQCTIGTYEGIVTPDCNKNITVQAQKSALQFPQNDDKIIVRSTTVRNGDTVVDIVEITFHKESRKVVDEMVLPKVEQRNIGKSSSGKGILGSSKNVEAASIVSMRKYYPPKSFSRTSPTDMTYLGEASHRAVDVVRGPMGSLLHKLGKLVTEDYSLADSIKSDIQSFSEDLRNLHRDLPMVGNNDKDWVEAVRQLAYKIEDMVDSFLVHREPDFSRRGFKEIMHGTVKLVQNGRTTHRQIGDVIKDIKADVKAVADRQQTYKIDVKDHVANATAKATIDLRVLAKYEHKDRLVGIETPRDEIIRLLKKDDDASNKDPKIISIVGMGGLGKTTLAKAVYDDLTHYHHKAFVSVGQNPDVKTVLKKVLHKCQENFKTDYFMIENLDLDDLIEKLQHILGHKRYFIVIDDIWDSTAWGIIKSAFPKNNCGSIIITTTRVLSVAQTCCNNARKYVYSIKALGKEESRILFLRRTFGLENDCLVTPSKKGISNYILKTCGGMPLAINTIASLLAGKPDSVWENVRKSLGALTEGRIETDNPMYNMKQILDLSYMYLTDDLKTCLLYACNYPEDTEIDKYDLLRQWVAEGFVRGEGRLDAEGVAENKFQALINMCMIEPGKIDCKNEVLSCTVHDLVLDLIRSKSSEVNFIEVIDGLKDEIEADGDIRRVSVHSNVNIDSSILATIKGSLEHVRSVLLYQGSLVPYFLVFRYVRVLHLVENGYSEDIVDLTGISRLLLLRYLKIKCSWRDLKLPGQIGELQQLETIDLEGRLQNYPSDIVTLPLLSHLRYNAYDEGVALPDGINRLKSLRILEGVCIYSSSVDNINGLGELTNLRKLGIKLTRVELRKEVASSYMNALHSSICKLSTNLRILYLRTDCPGFHVIYVGDWWHGSIVRQVSSIRDLDLGFCRFDRCPVWVGQLQNLYSLSIQVGEVAQVGVSIAAGLPSLAYFHLYTDEIPSKEESAVISGGGAFQSLKHLIFGCPKTKLTFEEGAMPRLEKLQILFRYHMARRFLPDGIGLLQADTLKEIILLMAADDIGQYKHMDKDIYWFKLYEDEHERRFRTMLKRAFKSRYPTTQVYIQSRTGVVDDREVDEGVDDEEHCCSEKDYEVVDDEEDE